MRAEGALRTMSTVTDACADSVDFHIGASDANRPMRSQASVSERVGCLLRQAMLFLDRDREAARRCLKQAAALLESELPDSGAGAAVANLVFRSGGLARWQAKRALTYIEANLDSKMDIRALAAMVALSRGHFARAFKRCLGLSPMAYVVNRRIEHAKLMMISTRELLTEIALASGFADQSHLSRAFRRIVGMSPGRWRRTHADSCPNVSDHTIVHASPSDESGLADSMLDRLVEPIDLEQRTSENDGREVPSVSQARQRTGRL